MWKVYKDQNVLAYTKKNKNFALRSGFTLAELAIVILILSILLLVVFFGSGRYHPNFNPDLTYSRS